MLTESFIASTLGSSKIAANSTIPKDVGIFLHEYQPLTRIQSTFKKSSTTPNCLVYTASHVIAAQADKAVILVYNREKGNQELLVPFQERTTSLVRIGQEDSACVLALGTDGGRLRLWELATGRIVSSTTAHLQPVTSLAVDASFNFLLSGSADSEIQVWSIPGLLSFGTFGKSEEEQHSTSSPLRTLGNHRGPVTAIVTGHSQTTADFAVSASEDKTCIVWDYKAGIVLHTFLLVDTPLCLALDPVDRAFYAGLLDGSVQSISFHEEYQAFHPIYNPRLAGTPTQPAESSKWTSPDSDASKALCVTVSYDGTTLLSGHENGRVLTWDVGGSRHHTNNIANLAASVTNLEMLPVQGFSEPRKATLRLQNVTKPKQAGFGTGDETTSSSIPDTYTFAAQLQRHPATSQASQADELDNPLMEDFDAALAHASLPEDLIEESIASVATDSSGTGGISTIDDESVQLKIAVLQSRLEHAENAQRIHADHLLEAQAELERRDRDQRLKEQVKATQRTKREERYALERQRFMKGQANGHHDNKQADQDDVEMLSTDTEDYTQSE